MRVASNTGFMLRASQVRNDIFVPRYYDPRIERDLDALSATHELVSLRDLIRRGDLEHSHGDYVPKMYYGTGPFPYIRTSDISNWELRVSPKHGVSQDVFDHYTAEQDVQVGDILFVHEGTYLIGTAAIVSEQDGSLLYQHHLAKFRVTRRANFSAYYLLAALASSVVQRQIRARQFSADIIDSVVGRIEEVVIPIPKASGQRDRIGETAQRTVSTRSELRAQLSSLFANLGLLLKSASQAELDKAISMTGSSGGQTFLGDREPFVAYTKRLDSLDPDILIPKYYDPRLAEDLASYEGNCRLRSIQELIEDGIISITTGDEIGRLNYGSGPYPFVRTSDLGTYELKHDAKQGVSKQVLTTYGRQDVRAEDILLVRDGTYLVGSSTLVFEEDLPLVFCGGIFKITVRQPDTLPPGLLYALLNLPVVRRQMRSKQFTRDVIDTLGRRFLDVVLPLPREGEFRNAIGAFVLDACHQRVQARAVMSRLCKDLFTSTKDPAASSDNQV